ncbi:MAG: hypothetical protein K9G62_08305 [Alphaproteobacteria bacterium]|nr:hypothetical protein [Alphaproteobacteria bacterium]
MKILGADLVLLDGPISFKPTRDKIRAGVFGAACGSTFGLNNMSVRTAFAGAVAGGIINYFMTAPPSAVPPMSDPEAQKQYLDRDLV